MSGKFCAEDDTGELRSLEDYEEAGVFVAFSPRRRDRQNGILHPAGLARMELDLECAVRQVARLGIAVEPENLRQVFVAGLEAGVAKRAFLWPTGDDLALITAPERLAAVCEDFLASEEGQWMTRDQRAARAREEMEPLPAPRLH